MTTDEIDRLYESVRPTSTSPATTTATAAKVAGRIVITRG